MRWLIVKLHETVFAPLTEKKFFLVFDHKRQLTTSKNDLEILHFLFMFADLWFREDNLLRVYTHG